MPLFSRLPLRCCGPRLRPSHSRMPMPTGCGGRKRPLWRATAHRGASTTTPSKSSTTAVSATPTSACRMTAPASRSWASRPGPSAPGRAGPPGAGERHSRDQPLQRIHRVQRRQERRLFHAGRGGRGRPGLPVRPGHAHPAVPGALLRLRLDGRVRSGAAEPVHADRAPPRCASHSGRTTGGECSLPKGFRRTGGSGSISGSVGTIRTSRRNPPCRRRSLTCPGWK